MQSDLTAPLARFGGNRPQAPSWYEALLKIVPDQYTVPVAGADIEVLAARSVGLGSGDDAWRLDATVRRLDDDLTALERAHDELADL